MFLSRFSIRHPAIIIIIMAAISLFGAMAFTGLNQEMIPPMGLPTAVIMTVYPGAAPEDINSEVTEILENQFATMAGISSITSSSSESVSLVTLTFNDGTEINSQVPLIREKINVIRTNLPDAIDSDPVIFIAEAGSFIPIMGVTVSSTMDKENLTRYIEKDLVPLINSLPGISKTEIKGGQENAVFITLDQGEMESREISPLNVYEAINYNNSSIPSGEAIYRERQINFRTAGEFKSLDEIGSMIVGYKDNSFIYLRDIADIELQLQEPMFKVISNGEDALGLYIYKRDEGNTIDLINQVNNIFREAEEEFPDLIAFNTVSDQSEMTNRSIMTVISSALTGIGLAIIIILLFLRDIRSTVIIAISIPLSLLTAMAAMFAAGQTLNILTLSGLTTAIGMIVDSSIVVLENTHRQTSLGLHPKDAADKGASEVGGAVFASATTTICVFAPLIFLTGIIGLIMKDLAQTIVYALAASALIALVVVPFFYSHLPERKKDSESKFSGNTFGKIGRGYQKLLDKALGAKFFVVLTSLLLLGASVLLLQFMQVTFIPPTDTSEFNIDMEMPSGYSLEKTEAKTREISARVHELVPEIQSDAFLIGSVGISSQTQTRNRAYATIKIVPTDQRDRTIFEIITSLRRILTSEIVDCNINIENGGFDSLLGMATGGQGFKIDVSGSNLNEIIAYADIIKTWLNQDPDIFKSELNIRTNAEKLSADLLLDYMGASGITSYEAGITSRILFSGMPAGLYRGGDYDIPLILQSELSETPLTESVLSGINIRSQSGSSAAFSSISNIDFTPAVSAITKVDRQITITVSGQMNQADQAGITSRIMGYLEDNPPPFSVHWAIAGTGELMTDSIRSLGTILIISLFLVYAVMVIQFEKFIQPLIIMASIPFCFIGVLLGLLLAGSPFSMIAMLGLISLGGIVVNNAIVLIDYINMLRKRDKLPLKEAILKGAAARLKPILMTTLTTLAGIIPMSMARGNGAELYAPLGQAIGGGLISSTLITLILIPVLYYLIEGNAEKKQQEKIIHENS